MTTTWIPAERDRIGTAAELNITSRRADGTLRPWVPIWVVPVGDELYVRSWRGREAAWFRHAIAAGLARIRISGLERDVNVLEVPADAPVQTQINQGYRSKYQCTCRRCSRRPPSRRPCA